MNKEAKPWSQYWAQGNKSSCVEHEGDGCRPEIVNYWNSLFENLEDNDKVLDICFASIAITDLISAEGKIIAKSFSLKKV